MLQLVLWRSSDSSFTVPSIGQTEMREYMMTWIIKPTPSSGMKESEVVHSFVDFLSYYKRKIGEAKVKVVFEVTLD